MLISVRDCWRGHLLQWPRDPRRPLEAWRLGPARLRQTGPRHCGWEQRDDQAVFLRPEECRRAVRQHSVRRLPQGPCRQPPTGRTRSLSRPGVWHFRDIAYLWRHILPRTLEKQCSKGTPRCSIIIWACFDYDMLFWTLMRVGSKWICWKTEFWKKNDEFWRTTYCLSFQFWCKIC